MTSALVTGATGFVGRHLVRELRTAGWRVSTASRSGPGDLVGDLLRVPLPRTAFDVVFHLAGFSSPQASLDHAPAAFDANAGVTARLARELKAGRFILASSCQVYGPRNGLATEDSPVNPGSPYAASKLCGEALAFACARDTVVLRPYNHTGPGQAPEFVCPMIARQIARAEAGLASGTIRIRALKPRRDFFDVRDMVRAYRMAAERGARGQVYNVATGRPVSIGEIARTLAARARVRVTIEGEPGVDDVISGDSSKFRAATGWRPEIPLTRTLADLLDHERAAVESKAAVRT